MVDISHLITVMIMGANSPRMILASIIALLCPYIPELYRKVKEWWTGRSKGVDVEFKNNSYHRLHTAESVIWWLQKFRDIKPSTIACYDAKFNREAQRYDPVIAPHALPSDTTFEYRGVKVGVRIEVEPDPEKKAYIYGRDIDLVKLFLNFPSQDLVGPFIDEVYKARNRRYINETEYISYDSYVYNSSWTKLHPVLNVKTQENTFLHNGMSGKLIGMIRSHMTGLYQKKLGVPKKLSFMFYGPPGCGKTSICHMLAHTFEMDMWVVTKSNFANSKTLRDSMVAIPSKSIVVINDAETILGRPSTKWTFSLSKEKFDEKIRELHKKLKKLPISIELYKFDMWRKANGPNPYHRSETDMELADDTVEAMHEFLKKHIDDYVRYAEGYEDDLCLPGSFITHDEFMELIEAKKSEDATDDTIGDLLDILDGTHYLSDCIVIMTSNDPKRIDDRIKRPGRIDHHIEILPADASVVKKVFRYQFDRDIDLVTDRLEEGGKTITQAELIHKFIIPNVNDPDEAERLVKDRMK